MSKSDGDQILNQAILSGRMARTERVEAGFAVNGPSHSTVFIFSSLASPTQEMVDVAKSNCQDALKVGHQNQGSPYSLNILNHGSFFYWRLLCRSLAPTGELV